MSTEPKNNLWWSDLSKLAESAAGMVMGGAAELKKQVESHFPKKSDDAASCEEFDVMKEMLVQAKLAIETLEKRVAALEGEKLVSPKKKL